MGKHLSIFVMIIVVFCFIVLLIQSTVSENLSQCEYTKCHSKTSTGHCPSGLHLADYESCSSIFQKRELCCPPKTDQKESKSACRWTPCHYKLDSDFCDPDTEFVRNFKSCGLLKKREECCPQSALDRI